MMAVSLFVGTGIVSKISQLIAILILSKLIKTADFLDIWRVINVRQYTWVKVNNNRVSAARWTHAEVLKLKLV